MKARERFRLRFEPGEIREWAERYVATNRDQDLEDEITEEIASRVRVAGFYSKDDFLKVCRWKSPRILPHCERNEPDWIEAVTRTALETEYEHLRIAALTLLEGVSWPVASVLLHFGHRDPYPILDYRALWSLSSHVPDKYDWPFWRAYVDSCRKLAADGGVAMRTLDRALWQYAKEHQGR